MFEYPSRRLLTDRRIGLVDDGCNVRTVRNAFQPTARTGEYGTDRFGRDRVADGEPRYRCDAFRTVNDGVRQRFADGENRGHRNDAGRRVGDDRFTGAGSLELSSSSPVSFDEEPVEDPAVENRGERFRIEAANFPGDSFRIGNPVSRERDRRLGLGELRRQRLDVRDRQREVGRRHLRRRRVPDVIPAFGTLRRESVHRGLLPAGADERNELPVAEAQRIGQSHTVTVSRERK